MNSDILKLVDGMRVVAILCNQWGDTGKGKFVALLAALWADYNIRGNGGDNAGHTDVLNGISHDFHIMPSGILAEREKEIYNIIGRGCVVNPLRLIQEMDKLLSERYTYNSLRISGSAEVITPQNMLLDRINDPVGSTGRGIGPTYGDETLRRKITINELLNPDHFAQRIKKDVEQKVKLIRTFRADPDAIKKCLHTEDFLNGAYYHLRKILDADAIIEMYLNFAERLEQFVTDTDAMARQALKDGKNILLEGAQGLLLSIKYGTYPYVTSSDCSIEGLVQGAGLKKEDVDLVLSIFKGPYMTRVGKGPFPTEFGGEKSDYHCNVETDLHRRTDEEKAYLSRLAEMFNSDDEFERGIALRIKGNEYGVTTGRPRRTGRLDLVALKYAMSINGNDLVMTKPDVMDDCDQIELCVGYTYTGPDRRYDDKVLKSGDILGEFIRDSFILEHCRPIYVTMPGWPEPLAGTQSYRALPQEFKEILYFIEKFVGGDIKVVSTGAERDSYVVKA